MFLFFVIFHSFSFVSLAVILTHVLQSILISLARSLFFFFSPSLHLSSHFPSFHPPFLPSVYPSIYTLSISHNFPLLLYFFPLFLQVVFLSLLSCVCPSRRSSRCICFLSSDVCLWSASCFSVLCESVSLQWHILSFSSITAGERFHARFQTTVRDAAESRLYISLSKHTVNTVGSGRAARTVYRLFCWGYINSAVSPSQSHGFVEFLPRRRSDHTAAQR